ncbi:toxin co-regulated pilus biosynthesis Q family protein [Roseateles sp. SL47]|jgi:Toxin co-regulated pilus biosynthesis protein Q|uniref:toxin co-regulated pilus biosynthesis Q family protein n=1 Tax=Roseateles sp. SL47 TaxID=2995138 RepID=UPI0022710AC8|nr:toxin co-regulated pilus biosynthesis Q family protein [Roseateles sp. SL47]WAC71854.1 toxin co-regulated pilus biosynthesis Q family protein [Roseateles sp. SL47]
MKTLRLLPLFVLGLVAGAQATAASPPTGASRAAMSSPPTAPDPTAKVSRPPISPPPSGGEVSGYGEVEWVRTPRAQPLPARPEGADQDSVLASMRGEASSEWTVELSDHSFRQTLLRWTRIANWQLVWEVDRDFAIDAQVTLNGNFLQALDQAMTSLRDTDYPVQARVNPDTRVVRVVRYMLDGERR